MAGTQDWKARLLSDVVSYRKMFLSLSLSLIDTPFSKNDLADVSAFGKMFREVALRSGDEGIAEERETKMHQSAAPD